MKITELDAIVLRPLRMRQALSTTNVMLNDLHFIVVRLETDVGVIGYGEALPAWEVTGETEYSIIGCVELYKSKAHLYEKDCLIGKSIATLDDVRSLMDRLHPVTRPYTVAGNSSAKAAIEQAMLDACARYRATPLHELLGVVPTEVKSAVTSGIRPVDETLSWVEETLKSMPFLIRLKVGDQNEQVGGRASLSRDIEVVKGASALIRTSGQNVLLAADANEGFVDADRTIEFCNRIEAVWIWWSSLSGEDRAASYIRRKVDVPLMAGEVLHGYGDAKLLLQLGGVDYFNVKTMKSGGILPALRTIDLAAEYNVKCHVGSMGETSLGCLMGCYAAMARPAQVVSTDMLAWTYLADEPWHLLGAEGSAVKLRNAGAVGTGVTDERLERRLPRQVQHQLPCRLHNPGRDSAPIRFTDASSSSVWWLRRQVCAGRPRTYF